MAEVLPQLRGRADTQSRGVGSKLETPTVLPLREATNNSRNGRITTSESVEGERPCMTAAWNYHQHDAPNNHNQDIGRAADIVTSARQLPTSRINPSKFMQTLSGNQASTASKSPALEERRDSQAIDPLSHVCLELPGYINFPVLK